MISLFVMVSMFTLVCLGSGTKNYEKWNTYKDIYTGEEDIDIICEQLDADVEAGKFALTELEITCSNETKAVLKKYYDSTKELKMFIYTASSDTYYQYYVYYFDEGKCIQAYYYDEEYTETETSLSEFYMYCENEEVFSVVGKEDAGDETVVKNFEDQDVYEYDIQENDTQDITDAIEFFKSCKTDDDLSEWSCGE